MLRALIVTHGNLGQALLETAQSVVGISEHIDVVSNQGLSRDALCDAVEKTLHTWGDEPGVVLTDILGGSCTQATLLRAAERKSTGVVTGINLAMLVDFLVNRERFDAKEMAVRLENKGKAAVRNLESEAQRFARNNRSVSEAKPQ